MTELRVDIRLTDRLTTIDADHPGDRQSLLGFSFARYHNGSGEAGDGVNAMSDAAKEIVDEHCAQIADQIEQLRDRLVELERNPSQTVCEDVKSNVKAVRF